MPRIFRNNGLSIVLLAIFLITLVAQTFVGHREYNQDQQDHSQAPIGYLEYLRSDHFLEAVMENWESEFLQMFAYGGLPVSTLSYLATSRFWFESFQNWQSEFLAMGSMVALSIFLRERGSPESKPVDSPHSETGRK
jgi:hypothetical protein